MEGKFGKCAKHPDVEVEYFCNACRHAVCVHCKMVGSHSIGTEASHKLIPIWEAYISTYTASKQDDLAAKEKKTALETQISELDDRLQVVKTNYGEVEKAIRMKMEQALKRAKEITTQRCQFFSQRKQNFKDKLKTLKG